MTSSFCRAVVGANFGDEGKGLMTDYFTRLMKIGGEKVSVCRYNGGAQAGHTVVTPEGQRKVFQHFSSGTLTGADTILGPEFFVNPIVFNKESKILYEQFDLLPEVWIFPQAPVTLPIDMRINQFIETQRGEKAHGSCGMGIFQTWRRNQNPQFKLSAHYLHSTSRADFYLRMMEIYGIYYNQLKQDSLHLDVISDMLAFKDQVREIPDEVVSPSFDAKEKFHNKVIFEGAQGLLLDMDNGDYFPHLTPSNCGLKNILPLADLIKKDIHVTYVTRAYMTRHGNGKFLSEDERLLNELGDKEQTNKNNDWQGPVRFGHLDVDLLVRTLKKDLDVVKFAGFNRKVVPSLAITCLDQRKRHSYLYHGMRFDNLTSDDFLVRVFDIIRREAGVNRFYVSYGPTWKDVQDYGEGL